MSHCGQKYEKIRIFEIRDVAVALGAEVCSAKFEIDASTFVFPPNNEHVIVQLMTIELLSE